MNIAQLLLTVVMFGSLFSVMTLALQLQYARGGMINFGTVAYFAAGAYAYAIVTQEPPSGLDQYMFGFGLPWWVGFLAAGLVALAFAAVTGGPTLRLRGEYLALTTFAFAEVFHSLLLNERSIGNGSVGLSNVMRPDTSALGLNDNLVYTLAAFLLMVATVLVWRRLLNSPYGRALDAVRPAVVINCVGLIKQLADAQDPLSTLPVNAMFPHRLARLCGLAGIRMIHVSTDCVFSGRKGLYTESDPSDAGDLYGKSKFIGEVHDLEHVITLRTSIIGHELSSNFALVDWFLSQTREVKGYAKAVFSGLPTVELASVIKDFVLTRLELHGLYHVAAAPITKLDLLRLIAGQYSKAIDIVPDEHLVIDRSLNCERFRRATGYTAPAWPKLIEKMFDGRVRRTYQ